jgi:3'-5' exonuclease
MTLTLTLLQFATEAETVLVRTFVQDHKMSKDVKAPVSLRKILQDPSIMLAGQAPNQDASFIKESFTNIEQVTSLVDIQFLARMLSVPTFNLGALTAVFCRQWLPKRQQRSVWEAKRLSRPQKLYAASDARVCVEVLDAMTPYILQYYRDTHTTSSSAAAAAGAAGAAAAAASASGDQLNVSMLRELNALVGNFVDDRQSIIAAYDQCLIPTTLEDYKKQLDENYGYGHCHGSRLPPSPKALLFELFDKKRSMPRPSLRRIQMPDGYVYECMLCDGRKVTHSYRYKKAKDAEWFVCLKTIHIVLTPNDSLQL